MVLPLPPLKTLDPATLPALAPPTAPPLPTAFGAFTKLIDCCCGCVYKWLLLAFVVVVIVVVAVPAAFDCVIQDVVVLAAISTIDCGGGCCDVG